MWKGSSVKMSKKKKIITLIAIFIGLFVTIFLVIMYMTSFVGTVNGEKISSAEYSFFLSSVKAEMEKLAKVGESAEAKKAFWDSKIERKSPRDVAQERALERLREIKIEMIKAKDKGITLSDTEIKEIKDALTQRIGEMGGDIKAKEIVLKDYGVSLKEYEAIYRELRIVYNFMKLEQVNIKVSDESAQKYYNQNREKVDTVTVIHVLVATVDNKSGQEASVYKEVEAKNKAEDILKKVRAGEDIKVLADKLSEDPLVKKNHGEYLVKYDGENSNYMEEFKNWALTHNVGDNDLVKTSLGYHVIKVMKRTEFVDVKSIAIDGAKTERFMEMVEEWKKMPQYNFIKNEKRETLIKLWEFLFSKN